MLTSFTQDMNNASPSEFKLAWKLTLPILFAYFPLGAVFGILAAHSGLQWWIGPIMSTVVYGGSVQFVALSMMDEHAAIYAILFATVFLAFRNSFYGLSFLQRFKTHWFIKGLLIFMLVDATYVILASNAPRKEHNDIKFCWWVSFLIFTYWVGGTWVGAVCSRWLPPYPLLSFILPAFFMVLVVDYFLAKRKWHTIIAPIVSSCVAYLILPKQYLLLAIIFSLLTLLCIHKIGGESNA